MLVLRSDQRSGDCEIIPMGFPAGCVYTASSNTAFRSGGPASLGMIYEEMCDDVSKEIWPPAEAEVQKRPPSEAGRGPEVVRGS